VLGEAFHWRYHGLAARMREIIDSGEIGRLRHVEVIFCIPLPAARRIATGSISRRCDDDVGAYTVSIVRFPRRRRARGGRRRGAPGLAGVDRWMRAELGFRTASPAAFVTRCARHD